MRTSSDQNGKPKLGNRRIMSTSLSVLLARREELESSLVDVDLLKLSVNLLKNQVLTTETNEKFASLDPDPDHLEPEVKVRYLLQHVYERVRKDDSVFDRLVSVLSRLGGDLKSLCGAMKREVDKVAKECTPNEGEVEDTELVEQDVPYLVEVLVSGSHLWDAIGIALNLPKHRRVDCGKGEESVSKLSNILTSWILCSSKGSKPATLCGLRKALASETVGLGKLSQELVTYRVYGHPLPLSKKPRIMTKFTYQSCDTKVTEDKSTLLEVQVNCSRSYQWSKDGEPLFDGADYSGVCSNMLYINKANLCSEGKYCCCVNQGTESVCSEKMSLKVIFPSEKKQLLDLYSVTLKEVPQDSWPPVIYSTFINLVLIKQAPMSSCDYYTIRGDMDDILESKEVVEYEEVFREYREGAKVVVEGRPGSGKTTLVHKLTRDWASGKKVLQGAKMVFLVTLRLLNVSKRDVSLLDLLKLFYSEDLIKTIERYLQECRGKGACFILDGLDEYPVDSRKNLVISELLFARSFLPLSMVIVASRPVATRKLKDISQTRIEVLGFSKDQIYSYVESYPFCDSPASMASKMKRFLDQHPNVLHMCYLPVHAVMICFLFNDLEGNIPHRETQIYEQFTIATLLKHKARRGEKLQLMSLKDLSGEEKESFQSVCKLAFDMIISSQQVVRKSDAQVYFFINSVLGLLTVERSVKYYGSEELYSFSHLTLQEFLAAFHMHEQDKLTRTSSLKKVFKFYCGLVESDKNIEHVKSMLEYQHDWLYKVQCAFESQQEELCNYVIGDGVIELPDNIISSSDFIALGSVISKATRPVNKLILDCRWDSDGLNLFIPMATRFKLQFIKYLKVRNEEDENLKALNCLLDHLPFLEELDLFKVKLHKFAIECLTSGITLPNLATLKNTIPHAPCSYPEEILRKLRFRSEKTIRVFYSIDKHFKFTNHVVWRKMLCYALNSQVTQNNISWIHLYNSEDFSFLPHERLSCSTEVVLVNCCIGNEGAEILANTLNTSILKNLVLDFNRISDSGAVALAGCLAKCSIIVQFSIQCNFIGDSGATALADALVHCSSLRKLDIQGNGLGDKGAIAIAAMTNSIPCLHLFLCNVNITEDVIKNTLEHRVRTHVRTMAFTSSWDCVSEADIDTLKKALFCGNLPALKLSPTNIGNIDKLVKDNQELVRNTRGIECSEVTDDNILALCNIIRGLKILHYIYSYDVVGISANCARLLGDVLKSCKSIKSIVLPGSCRNHLYIFDSIKYCTELHTLDLSRGTFHSNDVCLFGDHEHLVNLHTLNLSACQLGSDGAQVISRMLVRCKNLCSLDLSGTFIGTAAAQALKDHTSLLELHVAYTFFRDIAPLIPVLWQNRIQLLDVSFCSLNIKSLFDLISALCGKKLQKLYLYQTKLEITGILILSIGLKKFSQLVVLDISNSKNVSAGLKYLAEGLQHCPNLQTLSFKNNDISDSSLSSIIKIMESCKYLQMLNLKCNRLTLKAVAALVEGWRHKNVLVLALEGCFRNPHEYNLMNAEKCCIDCDHLLKEYYKNKYVLIDLSLSYVPKFAIAED